RASLRESAGARLFDQWLKPMDLVEDGDPHAVRLALPSQFMADWVRNHYAERLLLEFRTLLPTVTSVAIETPVAVPQPVVLTAVAPVAEPTRPVAPRPALDERLTFDRCVVAPTNGVAVNAAHALASHGAPGFP